MKNDEPTAEDLRDLTIIKAGQKCQLDDIFRDLKEAALSGSFSCMVRRLNDCEVRRLCQLGFRVDTGSDGWPVVSWEGNNA